MEFLKNKGKTIHTCGRQNSGSPKDVQVPSLKSERLCCAAGRVCTLQTELRLLLKLPKNRLSCVIWVGQTNHEVLMWKREAEESMSMMRCEKAVAAFAGWRGLPAKEWGGLQKLQKVGKHSPLEKGMQLCLHLNYSPPRPILDFWHLEL